MFQNIFLIFIVAGIFFLLRKFINFKWKIISQNVNERKKEIYVFSAFFEGVIIWEIIREDFLNLILK